LNAAGARAWLDDEARRACLDAINDGFSAGYPAKQSVDSVALLSTSRCERR
jgi:hypothetical protein